LTLNHAHITFNNHCGTQTVDARLSGQLALVPES